MGENFDCYILIWTRDNTNNLTTVIGAMFASVLFIGVNNCNTVQPVVAIERTVFYRERAAGMYSALPYALAQVRIMFDIVSIYETQNITIQL